MNIPKISTLARTNFMSIKKDKFKYKRFSDSLTVPSLQDTGN